MTSKAVELRYKNIDGESKDLIAILTLNVPEKANAFSGEMLELITESLGKVSQKESIRALVVNGAGKHFSAGADLSWMKASAKLGYEENIEDAKKLTAMFEALYHFPLPTIALVKGATFGGAVGLVACCDITLADEKAKFCLSEVKLGLLPAVILPYLTRRMLPGALRRLSLTARVFSGLEAKEAALVDRTFESESELEVIRDELNHILAAGPCAIKSLKALHRTVEEKFRKQTSDTAEAIAKARIGDEAQGGLTAFFEKKSPKWVLKLSDEWTLYE